MLPVPPDLAAPPLTVGRFERGIATRADYTAIARHHYRDRPPATFAHIHGCWHVCDADADARPARRLVGIAVLSWPVANLPPRTRHFALPPAYGERLRFANANVRTISRVIVHPQFRAFGIAAWLARALVDACPTRYVESSAAMGRYAGFLSRAGLKRLPAHNDEPAYFLLDKGPVATRTS